MARFWLVSSKSFVDKVRNANLSPALLQQKDSGAHLQCPHCHLNVFQELPNFPAGVKFDPSDVQLMEHLAAKCSIVSSNPHIFINEFIPTVEDEQGICYTHPENLPGAVKDGSSIHFFHRTSNAYSTGQRKRRRICNQDGTNPEHVRWHKTGKTKPVIDNGVHKGWKKIMVLYKTSKKGSKPDRDNWVMHQYHLGNEEDEKDGEFVVSKIFYQQPKQTDKNNETLNIVIKEQDELSRHTSPRTPATFPPNPPRSGKSVLDDDVSITGDITVPSSPQEEKFDVELYRVDPNPTWLAGESQAIEENPDDSLIYKENQYFDSTYLLNTREKKHFWSRDDIICSDEVTMNNDNESVSISELANFGFDTPPDVSLADMQFGSQDSWLDRI